jgi:hypothetical protein
MRKKLFLFTCVILSVLLTSSIMTIAAPVAQAPTAQAPVAAQAEKPPVFQVLNPRESRAPIDAVALAPRLGTLGGKTIVIRANYDPTMAPLARALQAAVPTAKIIYLADSSSSSSNQTPVVMEAPIINMPTREFDANPSIADAVIVGNGF